MNGFSGSAAPRAIALAGGRGVRALPLTLLAPHYLRSKAAITLAGRTLIEWAVELLHEQGVQDFYVAANGRENRAQTKALLQDGGPWGVTVRYSRSRFDAHNTGSGEATLRCLDHWDVDGPAVVFPTDSVFDLDLAALLRRHEEADAVVTVATVPRAPDEAAGKYGVLVHGPDGLVRRFLEKPDAGAAARLADGRPLRTNAGVYLVDAKRLREAAREPRLAALARSRLDWGGDLLPYLVAQGHRVADHPIARFGDLGSPRDYLDTLRAVLRDEYPALSSRIGPQVTRRPRVRIHPSSLHLRDALSGRTLTEKLADGSVRIGPNVRIGRDVDVAPGAVIEDCDVADGVDLGEGCELRGVACGEHTIVGPWSRISDTVLGAGVLVASTREHPTVLKGCCALGDGSGVAPGTQLTAVELFPRLAVRGGVTVPAGARLTGPGALARWN